MSMKWTDLILKLGSRLPLSMAERMVLLAMCFRATETGEVLYNQSDMACQLGTDKATLSRILKRLAEKSIVERRNNHALLVKTDELEAYLPGPVGSGRIYAGCPKFLTKQLTASQQQLTESQRELIESQQMLTASQQVASSEGRELTQSQQKVDPESTPIYKTKDNNTLSLTLSHSSEGGERRADSGEIPCLNPNVRVVKAEGGVVIPPSELMRGRIAGRYKDDERKFLNAYRKLPGDFEAFVVIFAERMEDVGLELLCECAKLAVADDVRENGRVKYLPKPEKWLTEQGYEDFRQGGEAVLRRAGLVTNELELALARYGRMGYSPAEVSRMRSIASEALAGGKSTDEALERALGAVNGNS